MAVVAVVIGGFASSSIIKTLLCARAKLYAKPMTKPLNIAIAGAGIGGLTAALALHAAGHRVTVYEAVREIKALGVGINLLPHAVGVLNSLGLHEALARSAIATEALVFANMKGQTIYRDARGLAGGYTHEQFSIHRGELQLLLTQAVRERLGEAALITDARLVRFTQNATNVDAVFSTYSGEEHNVSAQLLLASDGIHSTVRSHFYSGEGAPKWNGMMMWRGTTVAKPFMGGSTMVQAGHKRAKFVVYPISRSHAERGESLINWIADVRVREDGIGGALTAPSRADWSKPGRAEDLLPVFGNWQFDWLNVPEIISRAQAIYEWPMVDRDPLPRWSFGRVTLLGDAAHPMYPIGSNGATQAILDAQAITKALSSNANVEQALQSYEAERLPMTANIVRMNRQEGLDVILDMVHERAPEGFAKLSDVIDPAEIEATVRRYKAAAGHRPQASTQT
jgi:5-methylphenazine-1-carboxylate 1-monooxygenase